ncbi:hypothetical protein [Moraxella nonliquefaciens]|uniref:hypothetical protein n=1 Tax=Moraxella nonliquefaciens TaxID=478 RepID=UPI0011A265C7|nr:hypothetical protein [Moraxella nonliquefaciens]
MTASNCHKCCELYHLEQKSVLMGLSLFADLISIFVDVCSDSVLGACIASTVGYGGNISLAIYPILSQKNLEQICQTPKK